MSRRAVSLFVVLVLGLTIISMGRPAYAAPLAQATSTPLVCTPTTTATSIFPTFIIPTSLPTLTGTPGIGTVYPTVTATRTVTPSPTVSPTPAVSIACGTEPNNCVQVSANMVRFELEQSASLNNIQIRYNALSGSTIYIIESASAHVTSAQNGTYEYLEFSANGFTDTRIGVTFDYEPDVPNGTTAHLDLSGSYSYAYNGGDDLAGFRWYDNFGSQDVGTMDIHYIYVSTSAISGTPTATVTPTGTPGACVPGGVGAGYVDSPLMSISPGTIDVGTVANGRCYTIIPEAEIVIPISELFGDYSLPSSVDVPGVLLCVDLININISFATVNFVVLLSWVVSFICVGIIYKEIHS